MTSVEELGTPEAVTQSRPEAEELFAAHYPRLVGLAGLLGADDPEDVAQEAFARLQGKSALLRDPDRAPAYLRATVCNLTRNRRRHLRLARLRQPPPPDHVAPAESVVITRESHRELLEALDRLSRKQREALTLRYWLDLPDTAVAEAMSVSLGSAKTHIRRGLTALQNALGGAR
ncbi:RNA polymerase sigma factor [Spirillospora sp. CA-294931]|uniref:RNA polymerase sigma factor n=1 Tax=Spirillospora sp. CA-294931 TaxID=3240042 RepID=UPI003D8D873E